MKNVIVMLIAMFLMACTVSAVDYVEYSYPKDYETFAEEEFETVIIEVEPLIVINKETYKLENEALSYAIRGSTVKTYVQDGQVLTFPYQGVEYGILYERDDYFLLMGTSDAKDISGLDPVYFDLDGDGKDDVGVQEFSNIVNFRYVDSTQVAPENNIGKLLYQIISTIALILVIVYIGMNAYKRSKK